MPLTPDCALGDAPPALVGRGGPVPFAALPAAPPADTKVLYGGRMDHHLDSANFTVAWQGEDATEDAARRASEALELAWEALVVEQGWPQPVSSDRYLLWVLLDPTLSGTGLTVELFPAEYPSGYPVIYLNPEWAGYADFWASLAAHELAHAVQFGMRGDWVGGEDAWYWEASAEWMAELALPDNNSYALSAPYYAEAPELRFSSMEGAHQYGMFLLNASLAQHHGDEALVDTWALSGTRVGVGWDLILEESLGLPAAAVWGQFTADFSAGALRESTLYPGPELSGWDPEGLSATLAFLGTRYYPAPQDTYAWVEAGEAVLSGPEGAGERLFVPAGSLLAVTGLVDPTGEVRVAFSEGPWDTGGPEDSPPPEEEHPRACACASAPGSGSWRGAWRGAWIWAAAALAGWGRRRPPLEEPGREPRNAAPQRPQDP